MNEQPDPRMESLKKQYERTPVPDEIDRYIQNGMKQARGHRKRRRLHRLSGWAAAVVMLVVLVSVSYTSSFAAYMGKLSILDLLGKLMLSDSGIKTAVEHEYMQHVGQSVTKDGLTVTINEIIVDEIRMIAFYTVTDKVGYRDIQVQGRWIDPSDNQPFHGAQGGEMEPRDLRTGDSYNGRLEVLLNDPAPIPDKVKLHIRMLARGQNDPVLKTLDQEWAFDLKVDKKKFSALGRVIELNETVELAGQKITFVRATMMPTTTKLDLVIDPDNTMQIFNIEDLRLVDQDGREWSRLGYNAHRRSFIEPGKLYGSEYEVFEEAMRNPSNPISLYFEGNYLEQPESLTIAGSVIRALNKDDLEVWIDLDREELLKGPDDRLKLHSAKLYPQQLDIVFSLPRRSGSPVGFEGINLWRVQTQEEYALRLQGSSGGCSYVSGADPELQYICLQTKFQDIDLKDYLENPMRFMIVDYGYDKIHQPFRVPIF